MAGFPNSAFPESTRSLTPTRTLPTIRLDRAQRNSITAPTLAASNSQVLLFNNSPQMHVVVVRAYSLGPAAALPVNIGYNRGSFGTLSTNKNQPLMPDRALLAGQMFSNAGSLLTPDYVDYQGYANAAFATGYPFAVLPPGWGIFWITQVVNQVITVSVLWEVLSADEFAEQYGTYI